MSPHGYFGRERAGRQGAEELDARPGIRLMTSPRAPRRTLIGRDIVSQVIEVKVPDIGDFRDVPVIEVLVKPGDTVAAEDSLVTLESDKATMDVPSPAAGVVRRLEGQARRPGQLKAM